MKHRASLVLMELLIMVLVLALAASCCVEIFVAVDRESRNLEARDQAVILAQTGAEAVKAAYGDLPKAMALLEGQDAQGLTLHIQMKESGLATLGKAEISVTWDETGETLVSLTVGWQEVAP